MKDHSGHAEVLDISVAESSPRIPHLNEAELGWSQEELGGRSGLHPSYIGQIGRLMAIASDTAQSRTAPEARVRLRRTVSLP